MKSTNKKYGQNGGEYAGGYYRIQPPHNWAIWFNVNDYTSGKPCDYVLSGPIPVAEVRAYLVQINSNRRFGRL